MSRPAKHEPESSLRSKFEKLCNEAVSPSGEPACAYFEGFPHFRELPCNAAGCRAPNVFFISALGQRRPPCAHEAVPWPAFSGPAVSGPPSKRHRGLGQSSHASPEVWPIQKQYIDKKDDTYCKPDESLRKLSCASAPCFAYSISTYKPKSSQSGRDVPSAPGGDHATPFMAALRNGNVEALRELIQKHSCVAHMHVCMKCKQPQQTAAAV